MKKILVSQCLYGEKVVRYDGKSKAEEHPVFLKWKEEGRLVPVCPEVMGGLPTPRKQSQRSGEKVVTIDGEDVTKEYMKGATQAMEVAKREDIVFAIMKEKSPSCGSKEIYDGSFTGALKEGVGITVEMLRKEGIKVFSEEEIEDAKSYLETIE